MPTIAESFDEHWIEDPVTGCRVWQRGRTGKEVKLGSDHGYGCLRVNGVMTSAHRFAYEREYDPIRAGLQVRHTCHNTLCVNPAHMKLGTNEQNSRDRLEAGRYAKRLTADDVREIRRRCAAGETQQAVGADYGLHQACVSNIVNRKYWSHI